MSLLVTESADQCGAFERGARCSILNRPSPPPRVYKNNAQDCGLLGNCDGGQCKCYYGYAGESCAMLDLVPAPPRAGLRQQGNRSNWCGTILQDETDSDL